MPHTSFPGFSTQASSTTPTALVCGAVHPLVDDLQSFFRNQSVAVFAEKKIIESHEFSYAVYVGTWASVKQIIDRGNSAPKTLLIIINGTAHIREIEISAPKIMGLKAIIGREQDVLTVPIAEFFSFFFSRGKQRIRVIEETAVQQAQQTPDFVDEETMHIQEKPDSNVASFFGKFRSQSLHGDESLKNSVWENEPATKRNPKARGITAAAAVVFCSILIFLFYPVALFSLHSINGTLALRKMVAGSEGTTLEHIYEQAVVVANSFEKAQQEFNRFSFILTISGQHRFAQFIERGLSAGKRLGSGTTTIAQAAIAGSEIAPQLTQGGSGVAARVLMVKNMLDLGNTDIAVAEAELKSLHTDFEHFLEFFKLEEVTKNNLERLAKARQYLASARMFLAIAPESIGLNGKKTYLLLFQNNMELRPTGGVIGSVWPGGLLTGKKGVMEQ